MYSTSLSLSPNTGPDSSSSLGPGPSCGSSPGPNAGPGPSPSPCSSAGPSPSSSPRPGHTLCLAISYGGRHDITGDPPASTLSYILLSQINFVLRS